MRDGETFKTGSESLGSFFEEVRGRLSVLTSGMLDEETAIEAGNVYRKPILVTGDPGIGKTFGIISIIEELNRQLPAEKQIGFVKIPLSTTLVGELNGIQAVDVEKDMSKQFPSPLLPRVDRDGEYGVLFLDEITTADLMQVQPALCLCDDTRSIGVHYTLPKNWIVVAAGNTPKCSNFNRFDDVSLNRFAVFNISYNYERDWRGWAHKNRINPLILAFLNFKPEYCVHVISTEADRAGKQFASPRSWAYLSGALCIRRLQGCPVQQSELFQYAADYIGEEVASEFASFCLFNTKMKLDPKDILEGKVTKCEQMVEEEFHIVLQKLCRSLEDILRTTADANGDHPLATYLQVSNVVKWLISAEDFMLDMCINGFKELGQEIPSIRDILIDDDGSFADICPEYLAFCTAHQSVLRAV